MPHLTSHEDGPQYISRLGFGAFSMVLAPFGLWLALIFALEGGVLFPTRADEAWAVASARPLVDNAAALDDSTVISIERSMCFGWCPDYSLRLYGSGRVEYEGRHYVCDFGERSANADRREVRHLVDATVEAMRAAGYSDLSWDVGSFVLDAAMVTTVMRHEGRTVRIKHSWGSPATPRWLSLMEEELDRVAGTARWLPFFADDGRGYCKSAEGQLRKLTAGPTLD